MSGKRFLKEFLRSLTGIGLAVLISNAVANEWTDGFQAISYFAGGYNNDQVQLTIGTPFINNHNPANCSTTSSSGYYVTDPSLFPSVKFLQSTLLAAYLANRRVALYVDSSGCLYGQARILAVSIEHP